FAQGLFLLCVVGVEGEQIGRYAEKFAEQSHVIRRRGDKGTRADWLHVSFEAPGHDRASEVDEFHTRKPPGEIRYRETDQAVREGQVIVGQGADDQRFEVEDLHT